MSTTLRRVSNYKALVSKAHSFSENTMLTINSALGFATRNKIDLTQVRLDRNMVNQSFEIDEEDNINDGFDLLAKRLAGSAIEVWKSVKAQGYLRFANSKSEHGVNIKVLRPGLKDDYVFLKKTENEFLQENGKRINSKVTSYRKAMPGQQSTKKEVKIKDNEFNEQSEFPKMQQLNNGKWLVSRAENQGNIVSDIITALELFQSFGGKVVAK